MDKKAALDALLKVAPVFATVERATEALKTALSVENAIGEYESARNALALEVSDLKKQVAGAKEDLVAVRDAAERLLKEASDTAAGIVGKAKVEARDIVTKARGDAEATVAKAKSAIERLQVERDGVASKIAELASERDGLSNTIAGFREKLSNLL